MPCCLGKLVKLTTVEAVRSAIEELSITGLL